MAAGRRFRRERGDSLGGERGWQEGERKRAARRGEGEGPAGKSMGEEERRLGGME